MSEWGGVAIVGAACRAPGAPGAEALWRALESGGSPFAPLPLDRFDPAAHGAEMPPGRPQPASGALLEDATAADWRALRLPPLQVERMHRMERVALLTMCEALEDAGIRRGGGPVEKGQIWVAATMLGSDPRVDHMRRIRRFELASPLREALATRCPERLREIEPALESLFEAAAPPIHPDSFTTSASLIAGRVANLYDFRGGHAAVDAHLSSSLAAVERAMDALATDACDVALVCGLSPLLSPLPLLAFAHRGWLAGGPPRPFDPSSPGTLLGEGCAALVLKRVEDAGGGKVYAVLDGMGSAVAPRLEGQEGLRECVRLASTRALARAGVGAAEVQLVESRACGVPALDEAEARGLADAYRPGGAHAEPLWLTSAVPTIGFLQGASGMFALLRAALALQRRACPSRRWPAPGLGLVLADGGAEAPRRFGVSDAGPGPIAYHAILSAAPERRASRAARRPAEDGLAIVGAGILAPRANDVHTFWRNVLDRVDAIGDLPPDRFDVDRLAGTSSDLAAALRTRLAATVDLPRLDPRRFGWPMGSADGDPAAAMALLCSQEALQEAGFRPGIWDPERVRVVFGQLPVRIHETSAQKRVLFAGHLALATAAMRESGFAEADVEAVVAEARSRFDRDCPALSPATLDSLSCLPCATQVAAAFDFRGGALSIDAACASSLAALRVGAEALRLGDADVVVAGAVAYNLVPEYYLTLSLLGAMSPRGVWPFHRGADGLVPAEAAAAVVLKRLADAGAAGDRVYAVVRGFGASSDGRGLSIFAPSTRGQQLAVRRALQASRLGPDAIDYVEAHGTATKLGDRTEIESYAAVFGEHPRARPLVLGAVKSQVGHSSSAAGMVGVVKTALALRARVLPPSNGDGGLEADLPLGRGPLELGLAPRPWVSPAGRSRRAGVSAFGMGGVNHHVVLEEAPSAAGDAGRPALRHVAAPPARGLRADRFVPELTPVSLPDRQPGFPLGGKRLLLVPGQGAAWRAVAARLRQRGAQVSVLPMDGIDSAGAAQGAVEEIAAADAPLDGVVDMSAFGAERGLARAAPQALRAELRRLAQRAFGVARALYQRLEAAADRACCHVAVTALGGGMGLAPGVGGNVLGAFCHGFAQALKRELPRVVVKAVDFDLAEDADRLADRLVREIEDGSDRVAVGHAGRRFVVNLRRADHAEDAPLLRPIGPGDVFVFSGGGRGVVFECACAVSRLGARAVVTGRTRPPEPSLPWLAMDDAAFAAFRTAEMGRRRGEPGFAPASVARELEARARERELHRNLQRARAEDLPLAYEVCDVNDAAAVEALVGRVRARFGPITAVGHGAMVESSAALPRKAPEVVEATLETKVIGLANLLDATQDDPLRLFVAFGSGAATFGNAGQTDYAGANAAMSALLQARSQDRARPVHCVTIDWPAWESVGAAAANPDLAALLRAAGATSVSLEEGLYWFLSEITLGAEPHVAVLEERMLHEWPFLGATAEGAGERAVEVDDRGTPLVPGARPLVDRLVARSRREVVLERRLDLRRDSFLRQHRLRGAPILPGTFACEMLAEAAALACPGFEVQELRDVRLETPLLLAGGESQLVRVVARVVDEVEDGRLVDVETRAPFAVKGRTVDRLHQRGRVVLARGRRRSRSRAPSPETPGPVHARSFVHLGREPLGRGPLFSLACWIQVTEDGAAGTALPAAPRDIFGFTSWPRFEVDPVLLDTALQVGGSWDGFRGGHCAVPVGFGRIVAGRRLAAGERARVWATVRRVEDPDVFYDIVVAGEDDVVVMELEAVQLRRTPGAGLETP